jgi:hypothetical protein
MPLAHEQHDRTYLYHGSAKSLHMRQKDAPADVEGWRVVDPRRQYAGGDGDHDPALVEVSTDCVIGTDGVLHFVVHAIFCGPGFSEDAPRIISRYGRDEDTRVFAGTLRKALAEGYGRASADAETAHARVMAAGHAVMGPAAR